MSVSRAVISAIVLDS